MSGIVIRTIFQPKSIGKRVCKGRDGSRIVQWIATTNRYFFHSCRMLQETEAEHGTIMSFLRHGRAFAIFDATKFEDILLKKYFDGKKLGSFVQTLVDYGFRRVTVGPDSGPHVYFHELFLRSRPRLCVLIPKLPSWAPRMSANPVAQPNFALYPPMPSFSGESSAQQQHHQQQQIPVGNVMTSQVAMMNVMNTLPINPMMMGPNPFANPLSFVQPGFPPIPHLSAQSQTGTAALDMFNSQFRSWPHATGTTLPIPIGTAGTSTGEIPCQHRKSPFYFVEPHFSPFLFVAMQGL